MAFNFGLGHQFRYGGSTVTHTHKTAAGNTTDTVNYAIKQSVKIQDQSGAWIVSSTDCRWFLPDAECASDPKEGNTVTDGSDVWTILDAALEPLTACWECRCVKERS